MGENVLYCNVKPYEMLPDATGGIPVNQPNSHSSSRVPLPMPDEVAETLAARKGKYGPYTVTARIIQGLEQVMRAGPKYGELSDAQKESLHMIANKIGRILNGDVNYRDSWVDIAGYAMLAVEVMEGKQ